MENLKRQGVAVFVFSIIIAMLLEAIICQVDIIIVVRHIVIEGGGAEVPVFEHEDIDIGCDQLPNPNIELSAVVQKWLFDVFLGDSKRIRIALLHELMELW